LAARKQGAEAHQYDIRHDEPSFGQGSQEINDSDGLQGFRYRQGEEEKARRGWSGLAVVMERTAGETIENQSVLSE
jgi:hypothetical protein